MKIQTNALEKRRGSQFDAWAEEEIGKLGNNADLEIPKGSWQFHPNGRCRNSGSPDHYFGVTGYFTS